METPQSLFEAARRGDIRHIHRVLEAGVSVNARDEHGNTALMEASAWGRIEIVQCLAGAPGAAINFTNREGFTAFLKAAAGGHMDAVQYLAQVCRADVDATTVFGDSAATLAVQYGHTAVGQYLAVECGVVMDTASSTMVQTAADRHDAVARFGASSEANRDAEGAGGQRSATTCSDNAWTAALVQAAAHGSVDGLRCIVGDLAANVDTTAQDGDTALLKAAGCGRLDVVRYLVASAELM